MLGAHIAMSHFLGSLLGRRDPGHAECGNARRSRRGPHEFPSIERHDEATFPLSRMRYMRTAHVLGRCAPEAIIGGASIARVHLTLVKAQVKAAVHPECGMGETRRARKMRLHDHGGRRRYRTKKDPARGPCAGRESRRRPHAFAALPHGPKKRRLGAPRLRRPWDPGGFSATS